LLCSYFMKGRCQYWQQEVNYVIDVRFTEKGRTLEGFEKLTYTNNSPDTLRFIWFHLWPNAYKNDKTAFTEQQLQNDNTDFYFSHQLMRGYINRLDFKVDGATARTEDHPQHIDIIKLLLPKPLPPGGTATITTPFHVKLPWHFSRSGWDNYGIQVAQWYPKPAVYDAKGWHAMPYLDQGEFYSEFGNYDVSITVPKDYVVAATGELQDELEKRWLTSRVNYQLPTIGTPRYVNANPYIQPREVGSDSNTKTLRYKQDKVHDFAWFTSRNFIVQQDTCQLPSGKVVQVQSFYTPAEKKAWDKSIGFAKDALRFYSAEVGDYPYAVLSVVQGAQGVGSGMEYPTITLIEPAGSDKDLDEVIAHEIGHNWFYGALASNERDHPWMDEGLNTFYENKYIEKKYGKQNSTEQIFFQTQAWLKKDQPINTSSEAFSEYNYGLVAYHKTAEWLRSIESKVGEDAFRRAMQAYYQRWQFRHPQPEDFKAVLTQELSMSNFSALEQKGVLPQNKPEGFSFIFPFKKNAINNYLKSPSKNTLLFSPIVGANTYDKLMIGGLFTNYKLPPNKFHYLLIPMYATGSGQFTGLGKLNYTITSNSFIRKTDFFLNAAHFSMNDFRDTANRKLTMQFSKLAPGFRLTLREKDPRSTVNRYLQWKTFLFREEGLRITNDTIINGTDSAKVLRYATPTEDRYLNQLQMVYENHRALYPFRFQLQVEQSTDFVRPAFTANWLFNYPKGGGLNLRFFAGAFLYLGDKTISKRFANDRYHLNMSGPNGYEDYTYSDYFIGRNRFEGFASQQMMIRDGGFKVRTDLLASKVGKTDEWLMALNLNSTVPDKINPLALLPVKIPLRVFFDLGTNADGWKQNTETGRFLFDAGFHLPLLNESINIYIPVLYSSVFKEYFQSTQRSFFNRIAFSINLYNKDLRALNRIAEF
jgi:hypothetical protein